MAGLYGGATNQPGGYQTGDTLNGVAGANTQGSANNAANQSAQAGTGAKSNDSIDVGRNTAESFDFSSQARKSGSTDTDTGTQTQVPANTNTQTQVPANTVPPVEQQTELQKLQGQHGDASAWVTQQHIDSYNAWKAANPGQQLDFFTWAGSVNAGNDASGAPTELTQLQQAQGDATSWVTQDHVDNYNAWQAANPDSDLTFWEWAGSVNVDPAQAPGRDPRRGVTRPPVDPNDPNARQEVKSFDEARQAAPWVTEDHWNRYQEWVGAGGQGDFFEWAGSANAGRNAQGGFVPLGQEGYVQGAAGREIWGETYDDRYQGLIGLGIDPTHAAQIMDQAALYSQEPDYEWLTPEMVGRYQADQQINGADSTIHEWLWENYRDDVGWEGNDFEQAMASRAQRIQDDYRRTNPDGEDVSWVTPEHVKAFERWVEEGGGWDAMGQPSFWDWAGGENAGKDAEGNPLEPVEEEPVEEEPVEEEPVEEEPVEEPPTETEEEEEEGGTTTKITPGDLGDSDEYLRKAQRDLIEQQKMGWREGERALRSAAAVSGLRHSGGFGSSLGQFYQKGGTDLAASLSQMMLSTSEAERERIARQLGIETQTDASRYAARLGADASRYGADRGLEGSKYGADSHAASSRYGVDMGYKEAMGRLGLDYYRTDNDMLKYMMGQFGGADPTQALLQLLNLLPGLGADVYGE